MRRPLTTAVLVISLLRSSVLCQPDTCYEKTDILFVMEASGSVGLDNFQKLLQFAATLVNRFVFGQARFSLIRFESTASIIFGFNAYNDINALKIAILSIDYTDGGGRDTAGALRLARVVAFSSSNGARPGVPKVVVVCIDGQSNNPTETAVEAKNLKDSKVLVLTIGLGPSVSKGELDTIATSPGYVFVIVDYNQLWAVIYDYCERTCEAAPCRTGLLDILLLIDSSENVGTNGFSDELTFAAYLPEVFHLGPDAIQLAATTFSDTVQDLFNFDQFGNYTPLENGILRAKYLGGTTNTLQALQHAASLFTKDHGARDGVPKVAIIFTSGRFRNDQMSINDATALKNAGVHVIAIGFSNPNIAQLQAIASSPQDVFYADEIIEVRQALLTYSNTTCSK